MKNINKNFISKGTVHVINVFFAPKFYFLLDTLDWSKFRKFHSHDKMLKISFEFSTPLMTRKKFLKFGKFMTQTVQTIPV